MVDANLEPEGVPEASFLTRADLRAEREASGRLTRREIRERERRERLERAFSNAPEASAPASAPVQPAADKPAEQPAVEPAAAVAEPQPEPVKPEASKPAEAKPAATKPTAAKPASPAAANTAAAADEATPASVSIRNHVSYRQRETRSMAASGLEAPVGAPRKVSAVRGNVARVLTAESLFDVDLTRVTKPLQTSEKSETGPQPRVEAKAKSPSDPEMLRKARAYTLRGRRPVVEPEQPAYSNRKSRRSRAVVRKIAASGILLVAGAFVVATTVPVTGDVLNQGGTAPLMAADSQTLTVSASAVQAGLVHDGQLGINDALASARLSEAEIAEIQAVADTDTPAQTYWTTVSGYEQALEMMPTSYVQSPFPHLENVPITSPFEPRWGTFHEGLDFGPGAGTEIRPVANGIVSHVMQGEGAGGYMVTVDHIIDGKRVQTGYAHMEAGSIQVREGQVVTIDTVLGNVGSTGFSTGPHLHLEVRTADVVLIDPYRWLHDRSEVSQADWTPVDTTSQP